MAAAIALAAGWQPRRRPRVALEHTPPAHPQTSSKAQRDPERTSTSQPAPRLAIVCTVMISIAEDGTARLLAVRDENPEREWDPLGAWWPERYPGVVGIRDRRAGGAWMAGDAATGRFAVLLNRADTLDLPEDQVLSRGALVLESVAGRSPQGPQRVHGFNLLEVSPAGARVISWDGESLRETPVGVGTHMIAHDDLDDPRTPRIVQWLPRFRAMAAADEERAPDASPQPWWTPWVDLLGETTALSIDDDRAIIRDNRTLGYATVSLLYAVAEVSAAGVTMHDHVLPAPARWG